jgi:DNA-binding LacI/PurR family transcriptional regulator
MPSGLFIAEDRLVPLIDAVLSRRGVKIGHGRDAEIISCNNERPYLIGLSAVPATIDIRAESIGRRAVEQLVWRLRNPNVRERIRSMVEPVLVEPPAQAGQNGTN